MIQRQGDGFPLDQSRVTYLRYLRRERQQSPPAEADADHVKVKTEMLQLRLMEKKRELVRRVDVDALIDGIAGTVLTHLSRMAARCSRDMHVRRNIDAVVMQIRREIGEARSKAADECKSRRSMRRADDGCPLCPRKRPDSRAKAGHSRRAAGRTKNFVVLT